MKILKRSFFKDPLLDIPWFENWVKEVENINTKSYERIKVETSLGKTQIWGLNTADKSLDALVIFPGARTSSLFWDFDNGLSKIGQNLRLYLVETNGLPNGSDGNTPDIKSEDYGHWASEILEQLDLQSCYVAGASFGGLICMKLAIVNPSKLKAIFLLNAGCLQPFSLGLKNLYYNLLPILSPTRNHVQKFLDNAVFCKPEHQLSTASEKLIIDYEVFAISKYKDNTQKPYYMKNELTKVTTDTYVLEGDQDLLFPFESSVKNAKEKISSLKDVIVFKQVGHGIETYAKALQFIGQIIGKSPSPTL